MFDFAVRRQPVKKTKIVKTKSKIVKRQLLPGFAPLISFNPSQKKLIHTIKTPSPKQYHYNIFQPAPRMPNKIPLNKVPKKELTTRQAFIKFPHLKPFEDADKDGVKNIFDCKPFNKKKKGPMHEKYRLRTSMTSRSSTKDEPHKFHEETEYFPSFEELNKTVKGRYKSDLVNAPFGRQIFVDTPEGSARRVGATKTFWNKDMSHPSDGRWLQTDWLSVDAMDRKGLQKIEEPFEIKSKKEHKRAVKERAMPEELRGKHVERDATGLIVLRDKDEKVVGRYPEEYPPFEEVKLKEKKAQLGLKTEWEDKFEPPTFMTGHAKEGDYYEKGKKRFLYKGSKEGDFENPKMWEELKEPKEDKNKNMIPDEFKKLEPGKVEITSKGWKWKEGIGDTIIGTEQKPSMEEDILPHSRTDEEAYEEDEAWKHKTGGFTDEEENEIVEDIEKDNEEKKE